MMKFIAYKAKAYSYICSITKFPETKKKGHFSLYYSKSKY